ncbi:MAG: PAS domain-containing protein, partial [Gemmatimonadaceae bacterium]|nr:PAS domain-containing protein [Acetobacteraceae bacterium]
QDPAEAGADGMPRSAIATGLADAVLPLSRLPGALRHPGATAGMPMAVPASVEDELPDIIDLLRDRTKQDFAPYKQGTLIRRIESRMAQCMSGPGQGAAARYVDLLRRDPGELDLLARDLLIHVTAFFRDPAVFETLATDVIPELLRGRTPGEMLRVWVAGCSTGEEAYSLVILFQEAIEAARKDVKLQVFASDLDPDSIALAREGLYADALVADVSPDRLARFFRKEDGGGYRVLPDLRAGVVFTVQNLLADPPFSRLDLLSCRNLMIYLDADAQARAMALFHFALKEGGILLLGTAEGVGRATGQFDIISKPDRLYRHVGRKQPGDLTFASAVNGPRASRPARPAQPSRQAVLADLCRQLVMDGHAPAAVLCNTRLECLYSLGPIDRYLRVAPGHATPDLVAMARAAVRPRLRTAIGRAVNEDARVVMPGGRLSQDGHMVPFDIRVSPVRSDGERLLLVCFVDGPAGHAPKIPGTVGDGQRIAELERELETARTALEEGARTLEASGEEQRTINEETLSVNEEYQSTNEELMTSKEELQSLNEELTALNSQLQETLERQRTTSNDLQNILYSTDVATLFLDRDLNIRFFTPATRSLFSIIPGDIGRPLADLHSLAADVALTQDARTVLRTLEPVEREIETPNGGWFRRRVLPYRADTPGRGAGVEGVVITFNDITRRKQAASALEEAKRGAEQANLAKSRFLAAASHDLRQPLQTLTLVQDLLARAVSGEPAVALVHRLDETLDVMTGMLDTLLDLNQIEAGFVSPEVGDVRVGDLLDRLRIEFGYHAQAKSLAFRVMPCSATIRTDPRLLEQMVRNLLANALKYTEHGRILLGCRRQGGLLRIEVWDTGIGIPDGQLGAIFEEYHQLGNDARERGRGLGLGLSIVQRLGGLLGHQVRVRSRTGKGSVFLIEAPRVPDAVPEPAPA